MHFGISSFSIPWFIRYHTKDSRSYELIGDTLLDLTKKQGAKRLQLADNYPAHKLPQEYFQSLINRTKQAGIVLELGIRGMSYDQLMVYLGLAQMCSAPFIRAVIDGNSYQPTLPEIVKLLDSVLPAFEQAGVCIAIENHDKRKVIDLKYLLETIQSDHLGICLDTANSLGADEGISEVLDCLAPYTINLHAKEYQIQRHAHDMGFTVNGAAAGKGDCPWSRVFDQLNPKVCQSITLEQWSPPMNSRETTLSREMLWVEESTTFIKLEIQSLLSRLDDYDE